MKTIILIIFLILVGAVFGQQGQDSLKKDTIIKKYTLSLREVKLEDFTEEEQDFLFFHTTPAYCFSEEFRQKAIKKLQKLTRD